MPQRRSEGVVPKVLRRARDVTEDDTKVTGIYKQYNVIQTEYQNYSPTAMLSHRKCTYEPNKSYNTYLLKLIMYKYFEAKEYIYSPINHYRDY